MKKGKPIITLLLVCILVFSCTVSTFALNEKQIEAEDSIVELKLENIREEQTFSGYEITCDLVQEPENSPEDASAYSIGWIIVGEAKFRLELLPSNGFGEVSWSFHLDNGDLITYVRATFVVEKNTILIDPNIAKTKVAKSFAMMSTASGYNSFSIKEELSPNQKIRFKWSGITITGTKQGYSVPSDNRTGTVGDFT